MTERSPTPWILLALVAGLHLLALAAWGQPELVFDEADYVQRGQELAAWADGESDTTGDEVFGRLALHNPAYSALVAGLEAATSRGPLLIRALQILAGLLCGLVLFRALEGRVSRRLALGAALVLWLHPSMLFFRLTVWPVALTTLGTTLLAFFVLRLLDEREDEGSALKAGLTLAPLPFLAAPALLLVPLIALGLGLRRAFLTAGPALALCLPWLLVLSLALGNFTAVDLSSSRNLVLGNHPAIAEDRGSLWGDPEGKKVLRADLEQRCGGHSSAKDRLLCESRVSREIALRTVAANPLQAVGRGLRRVAETWHPDTFLPRHLELLGRGDLALWARPVLALLHFGLLALALLGLRSPAGRAALLGVVVWSLPVLFTVGFTRLRQPVLPWLLIAAVLGIHALRSRATADD